MAQAFPAKHFLLSWSRLDVNIHEDNEDACRGGLRHTAG